MFESGGGDKATVNQTMMEIIIAAKLDSFLNKKCYVNKLVI